MSDPTSIDFWIRIGAGIIMDKTNIVKGVTAATIILVLPELVH